MDDAHIDYIDADEAWKQRIGKEWDEASAQHMHIADGFSILALHNGEPVGLLSVYWRKLPPPLVDMHEGYIDIMDVVAGYRRRGIATRMIEMATERARKQGVYQLRAWSSEDKVKAIPMWKALGFGLCPATTYPGGKTVKGYYATRVL